MQKNKLNERTQAKPNWVKPSLTLLGLSSACYASQLAQAQLELSLTLAQDELWLSRIEGSMR